MQTQRFSSGLIGVWCFGIVAALVGCEGIDRKHDERVGDINIQPPAIDVDYRKARAEMPSLPDYVEGMMQARQDYIDKLISLERGYLVSGDAMRANWARRQRELTEAIEVYPYLSETTPEETIAVAPEESIPEADRLYEEGVRLIDSFDSVPFLGLLEANKKKAHEALSLFKRVLRDYPQSDKVDDCAFYCGEIYKEYLRDDDPDNQLALRYYKWAYELDPSTPHPARFQSAAVYDFRLHNRERAIELYHQVLETQEAGNDSNQRFSATRIEQLSDDDGSHLRPQEPEAAVRSSRAPAASSGGDATALGDEPQE